MGWSSPNSCIIANPVDTDVQIFGSSDDVQIWEVMEFIKGGIRHESFMSVTKRFGYHQFWHQWLAQQKGQLQSLALHSQSGGRNLWWKTFLSWQKEGMQIPTRNGLGRFLRATTKGDSALSLEGFNKHLL